MKKYLLFLAVAAMGFVACSKEAAEPESQNDVDNPAVEMVSISFSATMEQTVDPESKATIGTGGACTWENGNAIAIHTTKGALATLTYNTTTSRFEGTIPASDAVAEGAIAYYPASITAAGDNASVTLPSSYTSAAAAAKAFPLRGVVDATNGSIAFKHLGGILKVSATDVPAAVTAVDITFPSTVTGAFTVSSEQIAAGSGSSTVTVATASAERTEGNLVLEIPVPVADYAGVALDFKVGSDVLYHKSTGNTIAIARKAYKKMASFSIAESKCDYSLVGKFNSWDTSAGIPLYTWVNHSGWYFAKNVHLTGAHSSGFKFNIYSGSGDGWGSNFGASGENDIRKTATINSSGGNCKLPEGYDEGDFDIYFNPTEGKYCVLSAGDPTEKTVYVLTNTLYSIGNNYFIHVWIDGGRDITSWQAHKNEDFVTIGTNVFIPFKFSVEKDYLPEGTFWFIFGLGDGSKIRVDIKDGTLIANSSSSYGLVVESTTTLMSGKATLFTDLNNPPTISESLNNISGMFTTDLTTESWQHTQNRMTLKGSHLVYENVTFAAGTQRMQFPRYDGAFDCIERIGGESSVDHYNLGNAIPLNSTLIKGGVYDINLDITSSVTCDVYVNLGTHKAYVVAHGEVPTE